MHGPLLGIMSTESQEALPTNEDETDPRNTEEGKRDFDCLGQMVKQDTIEQRCRDESSEKAGEEEDTTHEASSHIRIPVWSLCLGCQLDAAS